MLSAPSSSLDVARSGRGMPAYAYAMNSPLQMNDPTGLSPWPDGCNADSSGDCNIPKDCRPAKGVSAPQTGRYVSMSPAIAKDVCRNGGVSDVEFVTWSLRNNTWIITCYTCKPPPFNPSCLPDLPPSPPLVPPGLWP